MIWQSYFKTKTLLFLNDRHEEKGVEKEDRRKLYDKRILPLLTEKDAAVFGEPVNADLWRYYKSLGLASILPENIFCVKDYLARPSLTKAILADGRLVRKLRERKFDYLIPYIESGDTEILAEKIGAKLLRPAGLTDKLNNKSFYRQVIAKLGFAAIPGFTVSGLREAVRSFRKLRKIGFKKAVLKKERSVSGFGVFAAGSAGELERIFRREFAGEKSFLIEGFIEDVLFAPNIQYFVRPGQIDFIVVSDQLMEKDGVSHAGNSFPSRAVSRRQVFSAIEDSALKFCRFLQEKRCCGIVGIDFLVTKKSEIYSTEANVRFNGSTFPALASGRLSGGKCRQASWRSFGRTRKPVPIKGFLAACGKRLVRAPQSPGLFPIGVDLLPVLGEGQFMEISY